MDQMLINKLREIVLANLNNENFSVEKLTEEAGISHSTLNRKLKSVLNTDAIEFIRGIRLEQAYKMLQNEEGTISEISYKVGFGSPAYFTKCFREQYGFPPGRIKEKDESSCDGSFPLKNWFRYRGIKFTPRGLVKISLAVLLFLISVFAITQLPDKKNIIMPGNDTLLVKSSIAVLPFKNLSEDFADLYVYEGIVDEIFNSLSRISRLKTISRTTMEKYRLNSKTVPEIAEELNVEFIIEGSGQRFRKTYSVRIQLIEAKTDKHIWGKTFKYKVKNARKFFIAQTKIAEQIASELKGTLSRKEKLIIDEVPTEEFSAYTFYLKANDYLKNFTLTRDINSYRNAFTLFKSAILVDTLFARAYVGLGFLYYQKEMFSTYYDENYMDTVRIYADKALSINKQLDDAYLLKGFYYDKKSLIPEAIDCYKTVLELNPSNVDAYYYLGFLYSFIPLDCVLGLENYHKAVELVTHQNQAFILNRLGRAYLDAGFPEMARYHYARSLTLSGDSSLYYELLADVELFTANFDSALVLRKKSCELTPGKSVPLNTYLGLEGYEKEAYSTALKMIEQMRKSGTFPLQATHRIGYALFMVGKKEEASKYFEQQIKISKESIRLKRISSFRRVAQYDLAATYAFLGNRELAYYYLEEASKLRAYPIWWPMFLKMDPLFDSIRDEDRFQKIYDEIEAKYLAEHERVKKWLEQNDMI